MVEQTIIPQKFSKLRVILLSLNLLLGVVLWFGMCTDYSWDSVWVNIAFPPIVGVISLISICVGRKNLTFKQKKIQSFFFLPSMIGGISYLILIVLAIVPPFLLATMFWYEEQSNRTLIQKVVSPDHSQIIEVYFLPVGAYSGGNGRIEAHLKNEWLPLVKRDIFYSRVTHVDENTKNYLSFVDNETIYIPEKDIKLKLNGIKWEIPSIISIPIIIIRFFIRYP